MGDGLYKLEASDQIPIVQSVNLYVIVFRNKYCLNQDYTCEHIFGNKSAGAKKGRFSGGISIYYKNCFKDKIKVIEKNQSGVMWLKILKEVFSFDHDVYICVAYIPPSGSNVLRSQDIDLFEQLELDIIRYKRLGKVFLQAILIAELQMNQIFSTLTGISMTKTYF